MYFINELSITNNKYIYCDYLIAQIYYLSFNYIIKFFLFILFFLFLIFFKYINSIIFQKTNIEINNNFEISEYENNVNYITNFKGIKSIAFFYPQYFHDIKYNYYKYDISKKNNNKKTNPIIKKELLSILIKQQVNLAKNHGIYGFAIYFNFYYLKETIFILEKLSNKDFYFPFFLIWNNEEIENLLNNSNKDLLTKQRLYCKSLEKFIKTIKKYIVLEIYININGKPAISINKPSVFPNINEIILTLRKNAKDNQIGEIFILFPFRNINIDIKYINLFDGSYDLTEIEFLEKKIIQNSY